MSLERFLFGKHYNILKHLPEAVLVIDEKGKIHYSNNKAFKIFETQNLNGKNINDYFIVHSDDIIRNKDEEIKQILKIVSEEHNTKITDVKVTDISSGRKKRYILTIIDNTQDHSLLDQLITERQEQKILNHSKNILLIKMSNYLRSPLHSIVGFSQAMLEGLSGEINDKQIKYLQIMNGNSSELLILIEKLIEISLIESDLYKLDYNNFDITGLITLISNEISVKLKNKDIKLNITSNDLIRQNCFSDKNILKTIISNLLENAISSIDTGAIQIIISNPLPEFLLNKGFELNSEITEKSYLMCEIISKGVDPSLYSNEDIFDPYVQIDKNSKKYLLQSLLLGSSKKYINKLKGEIWVNNKFANQVSVAFIVPIDKSAVNINQAG